MNPMNLARFSMFSLHSWSIGGHPFPPFLPIIRSGASFVPSPVAPWSATDRVGGAGSGPGAAPAARSGCRAGRARPGRRTWEEILCREVQLLVFDGFSPRLAQQAAANNLALRKLALDDEVITELVRLQTSLRTRLELLTEDAE